MLRVITFAVALVLACACSSGGVTRYSECTPKDTCPSPTTCESPASRIPTFCTAACTTSKDCPDDGVCSKDVGPSATPFCYQPCSDGCSGGRCVSAVATDTSIQKVCVPGIQSPIEGTSWTSKTIATQAKNADVTASTYVVTFSSGDFASDGVTVTGAFAATFTQTYDPTSISVYAGCTETTTFTGGSWSGTTGTAPSMGTLAITGAIGSTNRTGCVTATKNATNLPNIYDAVVNVTPGNAPYTVDASGVLTIGGGGGALPYADKVDWTFTKS
jgi:hypothetical protein